MDFLLPWPALSVLITVTVVIMFTHSCWFLHAQRRELRKNSSSKNAENLEYIDDSTDVLESRTWLPSVDILIPAKNEARVIESTIRNFCNLDYPKFTVWLIDDASDDETPIIAEKLKKELANFEVLRRPTGSFPGKSAGLNDALPHCRADVIAVFDADASVGRDFLKKILVYLEPERVGAVQSQKCIYKHQRGYLANCQSAEYALDTYFQVGRDRIGGTVELRGDGELIKREALIDVGGWNNKAITDDLDLTMRLLLAKWGIAFSPNTIVWEEAVTTWKGLMRQRRRWAEGSIRRYLDYFFPLNTPTRLSITERLDFLVFLSEFAIPGLLMLELITESVNYLSGVEVHYRFFVTASMSAFLILMIDFFIALRIYRRDLSIFRALLRSLEANVYMYIHWVPCVLISFIHIATRQNASSWHRTEHMGESH